MAKRTYSCGKCANSQQNMDQGRNIDHQRLPKWKFIHVHKLSWFENIKFLVIFLFYNGLRSSIPRRWLDLLATTNNIDKFIAEKPQSLMVKLNNKYVELRKVTCRQFYSGEIKIISEIPTCYFKWESEYFFADFNWYLINIIPYECTSDTYLQSIQYKIIHRYFPCK